MSIFSFLKGDRILTFRKTSNWSEAEIGVFNSKRYRVKIPYSAVPEQAKKIKVYKDFKPGRKVLYLDRHNSFYSNEPKNTGEIYFCSGDLTEVFGKRPEEIYYTYK